MLCYSQTTCIRQIFNSLLLISSRFIMYKLPRVAAWPGNRYVYSDQTDMKFRASHKRISTDTSPVAKTLEQVYSEYDGDGLNAGSQNVAHIFYNDGVPGGI